MFISYTKLIAEMKYLNHLKLICLLLIATSVNAQNFGSFNYQAVIRNDAGIVIANQAISVKALIIQGEVVAYSENHSPMTNEFGLINLAIGMGTLETGVFKDINWALESHLKIEIDLNGGTDYSISATSKLRSVPYAVHSNSAETFTGDIIQAQTVTINQVLKLNPISSPPENPQEGQIFINSYNHQIYCYLNGIWTRIPTEQATFLPTVTTGEISNITNNSAIGGGIVVNEGAAEVTTRGVCWSTDENPTIEGSHTQDGSGIDSFSSTISNLLPNTYYYVRAYATNSHGTSYGTQHSFATVGFFTDSRDGIEYQSVTIGNQTWMSENLAYLPSVQPYNSGSITSPYYYVYGYYGSIVNDAKTIANYSTYGVLYNWEAAIIACPAGWRLPSDDDWKILEKHLGMTESDVNATSWRYTGSVGGKLKETGIAHWLSPNTGANDHSRFTALPGGGRFDYGGTNYLGEYAYFWSSSETGSSGALYRRLRSSNDGVDRSGSLKYDGYSVRCIRNE
jgi:uncharacterized protein (TIGR02145 family)